MNVGEIVEFTHSRSQSTTLEYSYLASNHLHKTVTKSSRIEGAKTLLVAHYDTGSEM